MDPRLALALVAHLQQALKEVVVEAVRPAVQAALVEALPEVVRRAAAPEWQTRQGAADYLGVSLSQLDVLRKGKLPWTKRGRRVMLRTSDLDAYREAGRVPASQERGAR